MIDVVIVAKSIDTKFEEMTAHTIRTAIDGARVPVRVFVVEQIDGVDHPGATTIHYDFDFAYNKCLNLGASKGVNPYIIFCNNDLEFTDGWTDMIKHMQRNRPPLSSISPLCPRTGREYGWAPGAGIKMASLRLGDDETRMLFAGWCFMLTRKAWEKIGGLDERRKFWTADNATLQQLKAAKLRHGLDTNVIVHHLQSETLKTLDKATREEYEWNEVKKYNRDYNKRVFAKQLGEQYNKPK